MKQPAPIPPCNLALPGVWRQAELSYFSTLIGDNLGKQTSCWKWWGWAIRPASSHWTKPQKNLYARCDAVSQIKMIHQGHWYTGPWDTVDIKDRMAFITNLFPDVLDTFPIWLFQSGDLTVLHWWWLRLVSVLHCKLVCDPEMKGVIWMDSISVFWSEEEDICIGLYESILDSIW